MVQISKEYIDFFLSFGDNDGCKSYKQYYLSSVEIKNDLETYDNRKIATGQGDDYTTGCLLDYPYFKQHYKLIAIDLSKQ